ncbi:MAG: aspartate-semialdehyde dehydrogenase [Alicyclobacillus sp.]|nr:aspartate-semialdehyde dehydrogenase [Alicyclobacillus sp.]
MDRKNGVRVAVLGATGAVGRRMVETLERRQFPVSELRLLASPKSAGQTVMFQGQPVQVQAVTETSFKDIDIALFSAGAEASRQYAPLAVDAGAVVVDNSSAFRMEPDVPLVVPEVNPEAARDHHGIIANPNCSTIQLMVVLKPLMPQGLEHIVVSTYQAVSGMGQKAVDALESELRAYLAGDSDVSTIFPVAGQVQHYPMAYNVIPQCDVFVEQGYTKEEMKLVNESRKILGLPNLRVSPTAVRVPVLYGHSEAVSVTFSKPTTPEQVRALLEHAPGVRLCDDPAAAVYPHPRMAADTGETYVGRIRQDLWDERTIMMFVVADNLLKGAAWNAVQIAELLI